MSNYLLKIVMSGDGKGAVAAMNDVTTSARQLAGDLAALTGIGLGVREIIGQWSQTQGLDLRLQSLTSSTAEYADTQQYLIDTARSMNQNLNTLKDNYAGYLVLVDSGIATTEQARALTEGFSNAQRLLGLSTESVAQSNYGLRQILTMGIARAEEFSQVFEAAPGLLNKVEQANNMTAGSMYRLMISGELTADVFMQKLLVGFESMGGVAANAGNTIAGATMRISTEWTMLVNQFSAGGVVVAQGLNTVADSLRFLAENSEIVTIAAGAFVAHGLAPIIASYGLATLKTLEYQTALGISIAGYRGVEAAAAQTALVQASAHAQATAQALAEAEAHRVAAMAEASRIPASEARALAQAQAHARVTQAALAEATQLRANDAAAGIYGQNRLAIERQFAAAAAAHTQAMNAVTTAEANAARAIAANTAATQARTNTQVATAAAAHATAMNGVAAAEARATQAMAATTFAARAKTVAMGAATAATMTASAAVNGLGAMLGGPLGIAILGGVAAWQAYKSELDQVRVAGIVVVEVLLNAYENMRYSAEYSFTVIGNAGAAMSARIQRFFAEMAANVVYILGNLAASASGFSAYIPGMSDATSKLAELSQGMRSSSFMMEANAKSITANKVALEDVTAAHEQRQAAIQKEMTAMAENITYAKAMESQNAAIATSQEKEKAKKKESEEELTKEQQRAADALNQKIAGIAHETAMLGMSSVEQELYKLKLEGATDAQLESIRPMLQAQEAHKNAQQSAKAHSKELNAHAKELENLKKKQDDFVKSLQDEIAVFGMSEAAQRKYKATQMGLGNDKVTQELLKKRQALEDEAALFEELDAQYGKVADKIGEFEKARKLAAMPEKERELAEVLWDIPDAYEAQVTAAYKAAKAQEELNKVTADYGVLFGDLLDAAPAFFSSVIKGTDDWRKSLSGVSSQLMKGASALSRTPQGQKSGFSISGVDVSDFSGKNLQAGIAKYFPDISQHTEGFTSGIDSMIESVGGMESAMGYASAAINLIAGGWNTETVLTSAGMAIGTYFGGPAGAQIGAAVGGALASLEGGETRSGGLYTATQEGVKLAHGPSGGEIAGTQVQSIITATYEGINQLFTRLGSQARLTNLTGQLESSENGKGGFGVGGQLTTGAKFGERVYDGKFGKDTEIEKERKGNFTPEEALKEFGLDLQQATVQALQAADVPAWLQTLLAGVDAEMLDEGQVSALLNKIQVLSAVIPALDKLGVASSDVTDVMLESAGGAEQFAGLFATYMREFSSSGMSAAQVVGGMGDALGAEFERLGVAMPNSRLAFEDLISSIDTTTESGQALFGQLLQTVPTLDMFFDVLEGFFSLDVGGLAQKFTDAIFNSGSPEEAGQRLADNFTQTFYQGMIGSVMQTVSQSIMGGVVQPFLNSSAAAAIQLQAGGANAGAQLSVGGANVGAQLGVGGANAGAQLGVGGANAGAQLGVGGANAGAQLSVGGATAGMQVAAGGQTAAAALAGIVAEAKQSIAAMAAILSDPEVQESLGDIQEMFKNIGGTAYSAFQPIMQEMPSLTPLAPLIQEMPKLDKSVSSTADSVGKAADTMKEKSSGLLEYVRGLSLGSGSTEKVSTQLAIAKTAYEKALAGGDAGEIKSATDAYRQLSKQVYGDTAQYSEIDTTTRRQVGAVAAKEYGAQAVADALGLPQLSEGAIVSKPTIALIGERGPEMVMPLPRGNNGEVTMAIREMSAKLAVLEVQLGEQRRTNQILVDIIRTGNSNTDKLAEAVKPATPQPRVRMS